MPHDPYRPPAATLVPFAAERPATVVAQVAPTQLLVAFGLSVGLTWIDAPALNGAAALALANVVTCAGAGLVIGGSIMRTTESATTVAKWVGMTSLIPLVAMTASFGTRALEQQPLALVGHLGAPVLCVALARLASRLRRSP